jgi:hypothetical protein
VELVAFTLDHIRGLTSGYPFFKNGSATSNWKSAGDEQVRQQGPETRGTEAAGLASVRLHRRSDALNK